MLDVFVLRNQNGEYLSKSHEWLASGDSKTLYRSAHRDDIINEKVELTVKRPDLRISTITVQQADNGRLFLGDQDCLPKAVSPHIVDTEESATLNLDLHEPSQENVLISPSAIDTNPNSAPSNT